MRIAGDTDRLKLGPLLVVLSGHAGLDRRDECFRWKEHSRLAALGIGGLDGRRSLTRKYIVLARRCAGKYK
jgi:hypothetical protein